MSLTKQEMFDRAYRGLASQGWKVAFKSDSNGMKVCIYQTEDGRRCAWGWVDMSLDATHNGVVDTLRINGIGIAAELDDEAAIFAGAMQDQHDVSDDETLKRNFVNFGMSNNLTIPELP